jgi:agmatine deiminase
VNQASQVLGKYDGELNNISFIQLKDVPRNAWIRDFGPVYLINENRQKKIISFNYFGNNLLINEQIAMGKNLAFTRNALNSSGGAREVNGKGTMILCETHELSVNKSLTLPEIEKAYTENLEFKKNNLVKERNSPGRQ